MTYTGPPLQTFAIMNIIGFIAYRIIGILILALILRFFTRKYNLSYQYRKAFIAILIPSLIVLLFSFITAFAGLRNLFPSIIIWLLFFVILIFSVRFIYNTDSKIAAGISFKFFLFFIVLLVVLIGLQTIIGLASKPLEANVPQSVCTLDCEFAFRTDMGYDIETLTVTGYDVPKGKYQEREDFVVAQKTFSETELNSMERGIRGKIIGKLDGNNCNYMEFVQGTGGSTSASCKGPSKNFFVNLKNFFV